MHDPDEGRPHVVDITEDQALAATLEVVTAMVRQRDSGPCPTTIGPSTPLYPYDETVTESLEFDSSDALELIIMLEDHLGVELPDDLNASDIRTVRDIASLVASNAPWAG